MPSEWVYMTDEQKDEWLHQHGADTKTTIDLYIREVA